MNFILDGKFDLGLNKQLLIVNFTSKAPSPRTQILDPDLDPDPDKHRKPFPFDRLETAWHSGIGEIADLFSFSNWNGNLILMNSANEIELHDGKGHVNRSQILLTKKCKI